MVKAAAFFFVFVAGVTTFKSATNALFLTRRDPTDLPYLYLATALVVTFVTIGLGRQLAKNPAKPVLRGAVIFAASTLLFFSVLAAFDVRQVLAVLYVAGEVYATALSVLFWARLGEVFDVRSAKRVFGVIAAAGMAGAVLGGLSVNALAGVMPSVVWCFFAAVSLIVVRPLLGRGDGGGKVQRKNLSLMDGLIYAAKDRYPRGIAVLVLLLAVQTAAVDYAFRTGAVMSFAGDEAALASLFGLLNAVVGVGAIAFQTTVTRPLLSRLGVFAFLSVVPALCLLASGAFVLWPVSFVPIFALKTIEMMGSLSLNQAGLGLLYNPMPVAMRDSVRALVDGAVKKLGGAVGGVLLLVFGAGLQPRLLIVLAAALAFVLLIWVRALRPSYLAALERKLGARVNAKNYGVDTSDRSTRERVLAMLQDPDGGKVLAAVGVLERNPRVRLADHVQGLLSHRDKRVRTRAIELIKADPNPAHAAQLEVIITRDTDGPTAEAARALALVAPQRACEVLEPFLQGDRDYRLVCAAIESLTRCAPPGSPRHEKAAARLDALLSHGRDGPSPERRELVRLLGYLGPGPHAWRLASYLDDEEASVRALAIKAAASATDPALPPKLLHRLPDRRIRGQVIRTLASYGDEIVPLLAQTLDDRRLPLALRAQVPKVLRLIASPLAIRAMLYSNVKDDAFLRYTIVNELGRLRREHPKATFDIDRVHEAVVRRLKAYAHYRPMAMDLAVGGPHYGLLLRAVEDRVGQNLLGALRLLGLIHDREALEGALRGLQRGAYADALELLDVALEGSELRAEVLKKLETTAPSAVPGRALERAFALVSSRDIQLAAIAHETLVRIGEAPPDVQEPTQGEPLMPKSIIDRVFVLETVQLFHNLPVDDLAAVAELCTEGNANPREVIYEEGQGGDSMFVIVSGEVHLARHGEPLLDLFAGDSFGQVSILDGGLRPVSAQAGDEGVQYLELEREPFMDLMMDRPEVVHGLFGVLARRLRELVALSGGATGAGRGAPVASSLPVSVLSVPPTARVETVEERLS